ncbi:hypothetical protein GEV33_013282 [Tenebrio molitor]|uniref:Uncharacterized protein n=1 Tax=Tenebrio molitor TaxID=7067 RepID=A0A8J6H937_TENMO|nr:hypothetical protein GEV33_013282 [Tenebrio molitor]
MNTKIYLHLNLKHFAASREYAERFPQKDPILGHIINEISGTENELIEECQKVKVGGAKVEKMVAELKEVIEKAMKKKEVIVRGSKRAGKKNGWWDRECEQWKKKMVKALREWRRNKIDRSRFLEAKRRYRERCREKKKEVYTYINRERKKKESVSEKITIEEWEEYFMKLLEGRKEEGEGGTQMKEKQTAPEETEITAEELERQIRNLQMRKAPVRDGVKNEAWMYGTERMVELMNGVWRGEGFPVDWREGVICPIFKKSEKNNEEKGVFPDSQAGFRKGEKVGRKMDERGDEREGQRHGQAREKGENPGNRQSERCMTEDVPVYLRRESSKERKMMARFRCANEERRCRMCREENETIEHMWSGCNEMRESERKDRGEILSEDGRELGKWYYIRVATFLLITSVWVASVFMHLVVTLTNNVDIRISEDVAFMVAFSGLYYMTIIYVKNQPKVAHLLRDLSNFERFGKPPGFDEEEDKLSFWSKFCFYYTVGGIFAYNFIKLIQKSDCEKVNVEKGLKENCGILLDDCFSNGMFAHLTITAAICGCLEKQFVDGDNRIGAFLHVFGWIMALFLACIGGQHLIDASNSIPEAIWMSKWYRVDVRLRRDLLFMLARSETGLPTQHPAVHDSSHERIGERKQEGDFRKRMMMFESMVKSILMSEVEIWGRKEQDELERVQEEYLRWVLGVDRETPGYIVREECKRNGVRVKAGKRAAKFEAQMDEREEFRHGKQERRERIEESRYNRKYQTCTSEEIPEYLGDSKLGTRREKTGIGWKERKEGAECVMRRQRQ